MQSIEDRIIAVVMQKLAGSDVKGGGGALAKRVLTNSNTSQVSKAPYAAKSKAAPENDFIAKALRSDPKLAAAVDAAVQRKLAALMDKFGAGMFSAVKLDASGNPIGGMQQITPGQPTGGSVAPAAPKAPAPQAPAPAPAMTRSPAGIRKLRIG